MSEPHRQSGFAVSALLSAMMFVQFFIWGAWFVTLGPYMEGLGLDATAIGNAYTTAPIAAILSPLFLGLVADRFFASEKVLGVLHLLGGGALFLAPVAAGISQWAFIGVILLHMLCYMPTLGLTNTLCFHNMTNPQKQFPLVRVFGTIGWIAANWVISALDYDRSAGMFVVAGAGAVLLGVFSFFLPHTPAPAKGKPFNARDALGLDAIGMLRERSFAVFIVSSFLICIPLAAYYSFAGQFVGASGFEDIAATMSLGQVAEIVFMLVMPAFFARLGVKWMLLVGMAAWVLRYGLFAGAGDDGVRWMVLGGIVLHGICYDFFFVTGQIYVDQRSTKVNRGQAQGFLVLVTQGLGMLIGQQVFSRLVDSYTTTNDAGESVRDWQTIWLYPAGFALVIAAGFFLMFRDRPAARSPEPAPQDDPQPVLLAEATNDQIPHEGDTDG